MGKREGMKIIFIGMLMMYAAWIFKLPAAAAQFQEETRGNQSRGADVNPAITIALDPGHGGEETGAWYYGLKEKDANLKIAQMVQKELLKYPNVQVVLTRDGDEEVGLQARVIEAANEEADVFISLHLNASVSHKTNGATIYVSTAQGFREQLLDMADCLLGEFEALGLHNNGTIARMTQLGGRRQDGSFDDYYGVLRHGYNYGMPSLLIEHCFMDSETDRVFLENEEGLRKLALADANGIAAYYGLVKEDGHKAEAKHTAVRGGTTKGIALNSFEAPNVNGIKLLEYSGSTPGIATYEVDVADENTIVSLYLVYKNAEGNSVTIPLTLEKGLTTGRHQVSGFVPAFLSKMEYTLSYIGAMNEAGYEAGYNYSDGQMIGFGKCDWLNTFGYNGEADMEVTEEESLSTAHARWLNYEIETGLRERYDRYPAILYPD